MKTQACIIAIAALFLGACHATEKFTVSEPKVALVTYEQPSYKELQKRFSFVNLDLQTEKYESINRNISRQNRSVMFHLVSSTARYVSTQKVLDQMVIRGMRPALYEELLGFVAKYPATPLHHKIVALGSRMETEPRGLLRISGLAPFVEEDSMAQALSDAPCDGCLALVHRFYDELNWTPKYWFLAVQEAP